MARGPAPHISRHVLESAAHLAFLRGAHTLLQRADFELARLHEPRDVDFIIWEGFGGRD
jgi:hypothetical protein